MSYKLLRKYSLRFVLNTVVFALQRCPSIQGVNLKCSGRFTRKQRAVSIRINSITKQNRPSNTFTAFIDYSFRSIKLENSLCGIKLWIFWDDFILRKTMNFIQLKMRYKKKMFQSYYYYSMESKTIISFMFKKIAFQPFSLAKKLKIYRESQLFYRQRPHSNPKVELYEFF